MLTKPLEQIAYADLDQFVQEKWPEGKVVDYKRDLYGRTDDEKRELLKDTSSFANTRGGDILIGVDEDQGVPTGILGVVLADVDKEKLRLDEIIRRGIEPRIDFGIHHVPTPMGTTVLLVRVKESLLFPHRVVYHGKFGEFWARSSAGKYSMDTSELRRAFTLSESVFEKIRAFRHERITQIVRGETPMPLTPGGKLILHLIPVSSFRSRQVYDVRTKTKFSILFPSLGRVDDGRLNLDGYVHFCGNRKERATRAYTQFFSIGVVEAVMSDVVNDEKQGKLLLADYYERILLQDFGKLVKGFKELGINPPIWGFLTVTGVKGARIPTRDYCPDNLFVIDRDILTLPEFIIEELEVDPTTLLRPTFDQVWNASGFTGSFNFDKSGKWVGN